MQMKKMKIRNMKHFIIPTILLFMTEGRLGKTIQKAAPVEYYNLKQGESVSFQSSSAFGLTEPFFDYGINTEPNLTISLQCDIKLPCMGGAYVSGITENSEIYINKCSQGDGYEQTGKLQFGNQVYIHIYAGSLVGSAYRCTAKASGTITSETCKCGRNFATRIAGGDYAVYGQLPWQVALHYLDMGVNWFFCGGSILNENYVLTAAHCLSEAMKFTVSLTVGSNDIQSGYQRFYIERYWRHEKFEPKLYYNDIGLVKTTKPFTFNKQIYPICLPRQLTSETFEGTNFVISGFGKIRDGGPNSRYLRWAVVTGWKQWDCINAYSPGQITDSMLCANRFYVDTCEGDSGGALVHKAKSGVYNVAGIVSWGYGCQYWSKPGVYTRVTSFIKWIDEKSGESICTR